MMMVVMVVVVVVARGLMVVDEMGIMAFDNAIWWSGIMGIIA